MIFMGNLKYHVFIPWLLLTVCRIQSSLIRGQMCRLLQQRWQRFLSKNSTLTSSTSRLRPAKKRDTRVYLDSADHIFSNFIYEETELTNSRHNLHKCKQVSVKLVYNTASAASV